MRYVGNEKQRAVKFIGSIVKKFVGEGRVTYFEIGKGNRDVVKFKNDQSARSFIDEVRGEIDKEQVLIKFESFYKGRR